MGQIQTVVEKYELDIIANQSLKIWERQENPSSSAKSRAVQFINWAFLSCTSWDRYPEPFNA